jgi:hypothetical protein
LGQKGSSNAVDCGGQNQRHGAALPPLPTYAEVLPELTRIYDGSNGDATTALYKRLEALGPAGVVAVNLFRAQKASSRAKVYRGGGYRGAAYDKKQWSMDNLCRVLTEHGAALGVSWGWGEDAKQPYHRHVLYIDLPTGQVSFHTASRGAGPDYPRAWDGVEGQSAGRILIWIAGVIVRGGV